jgi:TPR repeat protein
MNTLLWVIGGAISVAGVWFLYNVVRGIARLRPQIQAANKKARQQKATIGVEQLDTDTVLFRAQRGDSAAQTRVGLMFGTGNGLPHDDAKAFKWFERAAAKGFAEAQYYAGLAYELGRGTSRDRAKARFWYQKAALIGNDSAQCNLGLLHLRGLTGAEDWVTAAYWFLKSASQRNKEARANLEWIMRHSTLAPKGSSVTVERYREAGNKGDADAAFLLGWCYEKGFVVPPMPADAARWYELAETMGHLYAWEPLKRIRDHSTVGCDQTGV